MSKLPDLQKRGPQHALEKVCWVIAARIAHEQSVPSTRNSFAGWCKAQLFQAAASRPFELMIPVLTCRDVLWYQQGGGGTKLQIIRVFYSMTTRCPVYLVQVASLESPSKALACPAQWRAFGNCDEPVRRVLVVMQITRAEQSLTNSGRY